MRGNVPDLNEMLRPERKCGNCISCMQIKQRPRKIKCTNPNSPDYKKTMSRGNICDLHEYE